MTFGVKDYPLAERHPDHVQSERGTTLSDITLDAVLNGTVTIDDLRITPAALKAQAEIARDAGRPRLADNFARAAELVNVPQDVIMACYELLRPGRARDKAELLAAARDMRQDYKALRIASFLEEAAEVYEKRGLFSKRY